MRKIKVLFFAADPLSADGQQPALDLALEARKIEDEVIAALHRDAMDFKTRWATRIKDLRRALNRERPDIVHFSGHGGSEGLVLEASDGRGAHCVDAAALKRFFKAYRGRIQVVVLNACHSQPQAEAIAEAVGCAIGTPMKISDRAAIAFSAAFYSAIASGHSVQTAFDQAKATLDMEQFAEHEWPVLVPRDEVDPSKLVLIPDVTETLPTPAPPIVRRVALVLASTAGLAVVSVPPVVSWLACAPVREVKGAAVAVHRSSNQPIGDELDGARDLYMAGRYADAFTAFKAAAIEGETEAMGFVGTMYLRGEGVAPDPDSAIHWLRESVEVRNARDARGMNGLGQAYAHGIGVERSLRWANHWYEAAATEGKFPEAMRNVGNLYRDGLGVPVDSVAALSWYERAARAGFLDAMVDMGVMYEKGLAVAPNQRQAVCWYKAASKAGSVRGKEALARLRD